MNNQPNSHFILVAMDFSPYAGAALKHQAADLIVIGTVGRSGIKGLLLGNTAEKVLDTCDCSMLTVKPDEFVSPIEPASFSRPGSGE
jgi:hypothetical protein